MQAGAVALSLLAVPLNSHVLEALAKEPRPLIDLRQAVGSPPQTTMRGHLRNLARTGILERHRREEFPGTVDLELATSGSDLLRVAEVLQAWLERAPRGPIRLGEPAAKSATKALVDGWSSALVRALVAKPLSLTELSSVISGISYPSLERRLGAMRLAGQLDRSPGRSGRTLYVVTDWLRHGVAPIVAGMSWERRHLPADAISLRQIDFETLFLLGLPLTRLPENLSGSCRLAVELPGVEGDRRLGGVVAEIREGRVVSCVTRLEREAGTWACGTAPAWLRAATDGDANELELGGDCSLARSLIEGLHGSLFGTSDESLNAV